MLKTNLSQFIIYIYLVLFTFNLAQVNERKPGFNQQNLVHRWFRQLIPQFHETGFGFLNDCRKLLPWKETGFSFC